MSILATGLPAGRLSLGLRMRNAYRVSGWRDTAVGASHHSGLGSAFKFRDPGFEPFYLLVPADNITVQYINHKGLLVKFHRERRVVALCAYDV